MEILADKTATRGGWPSSPAGVHAPRDPQCGTLFLIEFNEPAKQLFPHGVGLNALR
jgi:hypothetical protein